MNLRNANDFIGKFEYCLMSSYKLITYLDIAKHYLFIFTNKKTTLASTTDRILEIWFSALFHRYIGDAYYRKSNDI